MKVFFYKGVSAFIVFGLFYFAMSTSSCKKDETCRGRVTVVDTNGAPVNGALVRLDAYNANPPGSIKYEGNTDKLGLAKFDIKLPGILDVTATSPLFPNMTGKGALNVSEPGKETDLKVTLVY
jgi:hypothetical protein